MTTGGRWDSDNTFALASEVPVTNPVTYFGATGDGSTDDTLAFNDASMAAYDSGQGGIVTVPAGNYMIKGVLLQHHTTLVGSTGAVLLDADPTSATNMVGPQNATTTGTITTGSATLTVASTLNIEVGSPVHIRCAGGISTQQFTTLATGGIDASVTTVTAAATLSGWPSSGYLICGSEIIQYAAKSSTSFTSCTRGKFGTTAATHAGGATIGMAMRHNTYVTAVSGVTLTLADVAPLGVTSATVDGGGLDVHIIGLEMNGLATRYGTDGPNCFPVNLSLARRCSVQRCNIHDTDHGAINMAAGSAQNLIANNLVYDSARPADFLGAGIWIFSSSKGNRIVNNTISGDTNIGIYVDDRTNTGTDYDGPNIGNIIANNTIDLKDNVYNGVGIAHSGSHQSVITGNTIRNATSHCITIYTSPQSSIPTSANNNVVTGNTLDNSDIGIAVVGDDNIVCNNTITNCTTPVVYGSGTGNIVSNNTGWEGSVLAPQPRNVYADTDLTPSLAYRYHAWSPTVSRTIAAPTGTAAVGQEITFDITNAGGSAVTPTWNAIYRLSRPFVVTPV